MFSQEWRCANKSEYFWKVAVGAVGKVGVEGFKVDDSGESGDMGRVHRDVWGEWVGRRG